MYRSWTETYIISRLSRLSIAPSEGSSDAYAPVAASSMFHISSTVESQVNVPVMHKAPANNGSRGISLLYEAPTKAGSRRIYLAVLDWFRIHSSQELINPLLPIFFDSFRLAKDEWR